MNIIQKILFSAFIFTASIVSLPEEPTDPIKKMTATAIKHIKEHPYTQLPSLCMEHSKDIIDSTVKPAAQFFVRYCGGDYFTEKLLQRINRDNHEVIYRFAEKRKADIANTAAMIEGGLIFFVVRNLLPSSTKKRLVKLGLYFMIMKRFK
jgi:hypothetical protein